MTKLRRKTLPASVGSAAAARAFVAESLGALGYDELVDVGVLLVSELVTNAVLHAESRVVVTVRTVGTAARIEVDDTSVSVPARRSYSLEATTGRGMLLVDALSTAWGTSRNDDGKTVWFELAAGADS